MSDWKAYLGLPHVFGADPEDGAGADCLVMVFRVLDHLKIAHPDFDKNWIELAAAGNWPSLSKLFYELTEPVPSPEDGAVTLFDSPSTGLGIGVVVDQGLLLVHHHRGVCWTPLEHLRPLSFRRFRP